MNPALWTVTALLAAAYLLGGAFKLLVPKERIAAAGRSGRWVEDFSAGGVRAIGALEVLAAVGLVLPALLGIAPVLVPLAALGLVLLMAGAAVVRLRRREYWLVAVDVVYVLLAAFVLWGRLGPESFLN
ncbi:DoxX family protein [Kitasatospora sp. NPDC127059]|uniref:DoxX family protein n=1 Tax=unclassified Kitasatospora TaxID=2633591 RepID=UPI00364C9409